ncbi:D-cysteine desulfhydrase family protein [Pseudomonas moorei]|uniref:D-cysteine desulfhydrase n=1 Tax=Pseudomonas moorei TaxID=395599 RepID=A0A1H1G8L6_9PSED|nr:D-cysteine desulfhydrase family protein [Pseudomonas moorei]KAB0503039.1 D-cysteine desulfhydrase family protein [Pseudomonas moorei]SDR09248.1 D-cysteine desulfhydrase [Pseudomonas moorei]
MPHDLSHLDTALAAYPRATLLEGPTPIQKLSRLSRLPDMNGCNIYVKRDDLTGLGGGGNKLRKLEFLLGEALAEGADTLVTWGGFQSNHARLTAAVAAQQGLACELILTPSAVRSDEDFCHNGNVVLDALFGAMVHRLAPGAAPDVFAAQRVEKLRQQGKKPFVMPLGGSSPIGSLGYSACAAEILRQADALDVHFDRIIVPNGSAGTHSGLLAGVTLAHSSTQIAGYTVLANEDQAATTTLEKTRQVLQLLDPGATLADSSVSVNGSQRGDAYGAPTDAMLEAVRLLASHEGLLTDPVYGGKSFAGLLAAVRAGEYPAGSHLLFVMTGGLPGIFAYRSAFE